MEHLIISNIPQWAVCYIVYGDDSGLSENDIALVHNYMKSLYDEGIRLTEMVDDSECEFCSCPEFGEPCAVVDFHALKKVI